MRLKYYFLILALGIAALMAVTLYATFHSHPTLFYITEASVAVMVLYLWLFYQKTIRPYDTLIGGMELVRDLDLTTRLAPSGQHETDVIVRTFNDLLSRLRSEHITLEEQYTFLSLLIEASPMGIVRCDIDGNTTSMNSAARQMLSPAIEEAMRSLPLGETTTVRIPGEVQLFRISHQSFPDRGYQHPFYLIESLTSEVRLAEKAAYERVIRMIAHEVNNSVAGMVNSVAEDEAHRLLALSDFVTRFANVVKIPQPQFQLCDLSEEVEACRPFLENLCTRAGVRLEFRLTDEAIPVHLDTVLFQQVLINIVKNSVESVRSLLSAPTLGECPGCISISVKACLSSRQEEALPKRGSGEGASLVVTDNGRGIPPDVARNLFTPFFSTKPEGQGIGLLLIRDILTAHHCSFSLLTDPTDGLTRFTIRFNKS